MYSEDTIPEQTYEEKYDDSNFEANPPHLDGVPEMSSLIYLEAPNVLHNLECRYGKAEIYTSISKVLIAVNPYKELDVYGPDIIRKYRQAAQDIKRRLKNDLPPHVFTVAQTSYFNLLKSHSNQSMIVCGESGSGKTESAKHLMRYLAASSKGEERSDGKPAIENQVLDANPILESFGNAKTVLNNNSSRFGKFTKIVFQEDLVKIAGSFIETYLLEKSRVTKQDLGERNYHIFYMLCRAHNQLPDGAFLNLGNKPEAFAYLNQSGTSLADGINDEYKMKELLEAMKTLAISEQDQTDLFKAVAGVLHLGNVKLQADQKDYAMPAPETAANIDMLVKLYGVNKELLLERLTTRKIKVGKEMISKQLSLADGLTNREALSKALYSGIFQWIVSRINAELYIPESRDPNLKWIGILDVFGFESFEHNSFEQFCINFANERLQQYFNGYILLSEQEEYLAEAIQWIPLKVPNNQDVIDLIDKKPSGILAVLDSECLMPKSTSETFIQNLFKIHKFHKRMAQVRRVKKAGVQGFHTINGFSILHYAGKVIYNVDDFLIKNNDAPSPENVALMATSPSALMKQLMPPTEEDEKGKARGGLKSTGGFFSKQLESLMNTLQPTTPYFVRCIKPNPLKKSGIFDWKYVRPQLECGGIIEALRILKCGYPTRCTYDDIFERYGHILNPTPPKLNKRDFCEAVLRCCGTGLERSEFQLGLSKCFFRPGKQEFLEELLHGPELTAPTVLAIKRFLLNKRFQRARGVITAHISFNFIVRRMRAEAKAKRIFSMAAVISQTFIASLAEQRQNIAALKIQTAARAVLQNKVLIERKFAVQTVAVFFRHNATRKKLQLEVDKKIKTKLALLSERDRLRQEEAAVKAREAKKRDAEAKEQARLDAIRAKQEEEEAKVKAEAERSRFEQEERERKIREIEEKEQELKDKAQHALASIAEVEQLKQTLLDREKELQQREQEFGKKEKRFVLSADHERGSEMAKDALAQLIQTGEVFEIGSHTNDSTALGLAKVFLQVNPLGELCWYKPDEKPSEDKQQDWDNLPARERSLTEIEQSRTQLGQLALLKIKKVEILRNSEDFVFLVYGDGDRPICLDLVASNAQVRSKWCTALRYAVRNIAEFGTVSRPVIDPQRGHWSCAELQDRIYELMGQSAKQTEMIDSLEKLLLQEASTSSKKPPPPPTPPPLTPIDNKELKEFIERELKVASREIAELRTRNQELQNELDVAAEMKVRFKTLEEELESRKKDDDKKLATPPKQVTVHMPENSILSKLGGKKPLPGPPPAADKELARQIEDLRRMNKALTTQLANPQTKRGGLGEAANFADRMKLEETELQNQKLSRQNQELEDKVSELESLLEVAKLRGPTKAMGDNEEAKVKETIQKVLAAKKAAATAENKVHEAEEKVRKRQDIIRNAMKVVSERDKELQTTQATMEVLGINADTNAEDLQDETARKLASLKLEQKAKQAAAKHILVSNYEAMVREAEVLNERNMELAQKNAAKEENLQITKDLMSKARGEKVVGARRPPGAGKDGPAADDGCVVS